MNQNSTDDGSLSFLNIPADASSKHFNCEVITQQKLTNRTFYLMGYFDNIKTKFGDGRTLVKIKFNLEDGEESARKFFTKSPEIIYVLKAIAERNAYPRRVTMRASGNRYYFE